MRDSDLARIMLIELSFIMHLRLQQYSNKSGRFIERS